MAKRSDKKFLGEDWMFRQNKEHHMKGCVTSVCMSGNECEVQEAMEGEVWSSMDAKGKGR